MLIREARREDVSSIVKACRASVPEEDMIGFTAPEWGTFRDAEKLKAIWTTGNRLEEGYEVIVSEMDGKVVGFLVFKSEKDYLYIDQVSIDKSEQRKGVGKALLQYIERLAIKNGLERIETDTTENAQGVPWRSYDFWLKMGFQDTGKRLETKWDFKEIHFVKWLS